MVTPDRSGPQENITAFWSMVAPGYEAHPGNVVAYGTTEYGAWSDTIAAALPAAPADVLDVATGTGFVALLAAELGHRVTGIDLSEEMLAVARTTAAARGLDVRLLVGDAVTPDFPPSSFDVVTSRHLLWTLREPATALAQWHRLLRPGGRVVAIDGFWFRPPDDGSAEPAPGPFADHYTAETRAALPIMQLDDPAAVVPFFESAGFSEVTVTSLTALPNDDAGGEIPYLISGQKLSSL